MTPIPVRHITHTFLYLAPITRVWCRVGDYDCLLLRLDPLAFSLAAGHFRGLCGIPQYFTVHDGCIFVIPRNDGHAIGWERG